MKLGDEVPLPEPGAGAGIKTGAAPRGSEIFVVDIDGDEALKCWDSFVSGKIPRPYTVATGRGWQFYFEHPGFPVKNSAGDLAPGIDIRGEGGFVVSPGSPHKNGRTYEVINDVPIGPAPAWLLDWLRSRAPEATPTQTYPGDVTDPDELEYRRELYARYLINDAPHRGPERRGKGDSTLFDVVQRGAYDLALPTDDVLELIAEHYDPRCDPPWGDELEERVRHKAHDAKTRSTRPRAEPLPRDLGHLAGLEPHPLPLDAGNETSAKKKRRQGIVWGGWDEPIEPIDYLVEGLMPVDTVGMFVAMGSSLKTWTALDIARCVSKGSPWLDRFPTKQGRALIVDFESGMYELRRRISLLEGGEVVDLGAWCSPDGYRIDGDEFWKEIAKIEGLRFVVIDSLAAGAPGVDENDTNAALPLKYAARFTEAFPEGARPTVLFIHHSRKDDADDRKMVRGSTAIFADCDWVYKFDSVEETQAGRRMRMVCTKASMGPKPNPVQLELTEKAKLVWFDETNQAKATSFDNSPESIRAGIKLALSGGVYIETKALVAKAVGRRSEAVSPELDALVVRREVAFIKGAGYCLDNDETRAKRVTTFIGGYDMWRSESALAKASQVSTETVSKLIREGKICRSADGRWHVVDRS